MRAVWLVPDKDFLKERESMGGDRRDEVWDGVLHMVPEPTLVHNTFEFQLHVALAPIASARGLDHHQQAAIRDPARGWEEYRKPDISIVSRDQASEAAIEGRAVLAVEVVSPHDESREKMPFYARRGVQEIWLVHPRTRAVEAFALREGAYEPVPVIGGVITSPALGITLEVIEGPKLRLRDGEYVADV